MKINSEFLTNHKELTHDFNTSSTHTREAFLKSLMNIASTDLALAHSIFKTSAVRTVMSSLEKKMPKEFIGAFSVYKKFDTVELRGGKLYGKKHWISNADNANIAIIQVKTDKGIMLCKTSIPSGQEQFLVSPGMMDSSTYDVDFIGETAEPLFLKTDTQYFDTSKHNTLAFIANHLGAVSGLLPHMSNKSDLLSEHKNLLIVLHHCIKTNDEIPSDAFWHQRNALYLQSKQLLVRTLQRIIEFDGGMFYSLNSRQGRHFFNCLTYSGHNGPMQANYLTTFTEPQDY